MVNLARHLLAIAVLPFTVVVLIPIWLGMRYDVSFRFPASMLSVATASLGLTISVGGFLLAAASLKRFAVDGRGTLAPWDPPKSLVISGAYGHVRHPMISGVTLMLFGEALVLRSLPHTLWAVAFVGINAVYLTLVEEPGLEQRFGDSYRDYRHHVPPLVPRLRRWRG